MSETRDQDPPLPYTDPLASLRTALRGRYEIERQIGQGAYATVYLARDLKHERKVAIKVLTADPKSETGEIRFIREIRLVARLQHPNILPLHDSGHVETLLYYVMPYVQGETLRIRMQRERQMGVTAACNIARETADALAYAHGQGIVHRDIKPENILLSGGHAIVADFGIARAIDVGGVKQLTMTGMGGPGTPAYMSPEQLLGDRGVDSRSDIYSLGCVLYEMLAGKPPFPGKDGFVKRFTERPSHIASLRRDAPPWVDEVVMRALAKDPADRYASASDFVAALTQSVPPIRTPAREYTMRNALASPPLFDSDPLEEQEMAGPSAISYPASGSDPRRAEPASDPSALRRAIARVPPSRRLTVAAIALIVIVAVAVAARAGSFGAVFGSSPEVDAGRFAVLASTASAPTVASVGARVSDSLYDAFAKWDGAPVISDTKVADIVTEAGSQASTADRAIALARSAGAGKAVWVQASGNPATPRLRIYLLDARSGAALDDFAVPIEARDRAFYSSAVLRLIGLANRPVAAAGCDDRTRSYRAWRACNEGHVALAAWNVPNAERAFREAVNADAAYSPARLWLAQVIAWHTPENRNEFNDLVRSAKESGLTTRDSLAAVGLIALLDQRFPHACAAYGQLTRLDSLDYLGWNGLGECQALDSTVVASPSSPSGWAFRTSWHSAVRNYMTALRVAPGAHTILGSSKLQGLLPVASTLTRPGFGNTPERARFVAYPTLDGGDTVGYVPYLRKDFANLERPPAADAALRRNVTLLYEYAAGAAERFPLSARAQEALAHALEARAELGAGPARATGAMRAIDSAIALVMRTGESTEKARDVARLRARKVRIHFKRGEFAAARILADSLLVAPAAPAGSEELLWVAALTGRAELAAQHYQPIPGMRTVRGATVPANVVVPASKYFMYSALGVCGSSLTSARDELEKALRDYIADDIRGTLRADLAARPAFLSAPCTNGQSALLFPDGGDRVIIAQQAFARGDVQRARNMLIAAADAQRGRRTGDVSVEYVFQQAWLRTQVGDTAAAESAIDAALGALPTFSAATFRDPGGAATFGRLMALRAEIAAKRGDGRTARRWAAALNDLWASSDPALKRTAAEVRALAASSPR